MRLNGRGLSRNFDEMKEAFDGRRSGADEHAPAAQT